MIQTVVPVFCEGFGNYFWQWVYNASNAELLRTHSEDFAEKVRQQSIDPRIPWLYVFHLEFRFT